MSLTRNSDPLGLLSLVAGIEGNVTVGGGLNGSYGVFLTTGGDTGPVDGGVVVTAGGSVGLSASANRFVSILFGGRENIDGVTETVSIPLLVVDLEIHKSGLTGEWIGFGFGVGPGVGFSFDKENAASLSVRDVLNAFGGLFGNNAGEAPASGEGVCE